MLEHSVTDTRSYSFSTADGKLLDIPEEYMRRMLIFSAFFDQTGKCCMHPMELVLPNMMQQVADYIKTYLSTITEDNEAQQLRLKSYPKYQVSLDGKFCDEPVTSYPDEVFSNIVSEGPDITAEDISLLNELPKELLDNSDFFGYGIGVPVQRPKKSASFNFIHHTASIKETKYISSIDTRNLHDVAKVFSPTCFVYVIGGKLFQYSRATRAMLSPNRYWDSLTYSGATIQYG